MPHIMIESGQISNEKKEQLILELTKHAAQIMDIPPQFFSMTIHELPDTNYGIGGKSIAITKKEYSENHK